MIVFIIIGLVAGGLLGMRLTVAALIPATALAMNVAALAWVLNPKVSQWSVLHLFVLVVFLQIGYLCGAALRLLVMLLLVERRDTVVRSPH